ncbi:MAG: rhomboid family intramembrane serine protease [Proteobacteria bacterium]|nr:rhomboid family intramembrane serine protease [Pseudomonadota bacterium]
MIPLKDTIPSRTFPFINYTIILINLLCFLYQLSLGPHLEKFLYAWGVVPAQFFAPLSIGHLHLSQRILPLFTSMFLHGGWLHFLGNMLYLYIFGDNVEDRLGHARYLLFYLLCGVLAAAAHLLTNHDSRLPTIGASGAIAGVMGAYFFLYPYARVVTLIFIVFFFDIVEIPAFFFLAFGFIFQFLSGTIIATQDAMSGGVAWWAHIGGFLAGILLLFVFGVRRTGRRMRVFS